MRIGTRNLFNVHYNGALMPCGGKARGPRFGGSGSSVKPIVITKLTRLRQWETYQEWLYGDHNMSWFARRENVHYQTIRDAFCDIEHRLNTLGLEALEDWAQKKDL